MTDAAVAPAGNAQSNGAAQPSAGADAAARSALLSDGGAEQTGAEAGRSDGQGHNSGGSFDKNGDWRAGFADGLDDGTKETWGKLSSRYTSPTDMAKAHVELVRSMDKRIAIPGENAKPEEVDAVFQKLGMPEKAEDYKFNMDTVEHWDASRKEQIKGFAPLFRKARATQAQVDAFISQQAEIDKMQADAMQAQVSTVSQQRMKQLKTEWRGDDFDRNKSFVATTVKTYAGADTDEIASARLSDGTFVVDHPAFARMFAKIGATHAEDDRAPSAFNGGARDSAKAQIDQIESEALAKGWSPTHPSWPHAKLDALYKKTAGTKNLFNAA